MTKETEMGVKHTNGEVECKYRFHQTRFSSLIKARGNPKETRHLNNRCILTKRPCSFKNCSEKNCTVPNFK